MDLLVTEYYLLVYTSGVTLNILGINKVSEEVEEVQANVPLF
jgi:hypothetical protein